MKQEKQIKVVKKSKTQPRCKYDGKAYVIEERAGQTIRISNGKEMFCILKDNVEPTNKEARELLA